MLPLFALYIGACATAAPEIEAAENGNESAGPEMRVMSFNILHDTGTSQYPWTNRRDAVVKMLKAEKIDILGMQESRLNQIEYLLKQMPGYAYAGAGRDDGRLAGEFDSAIIYRSSRFTPAESATFWLSETPDLPGRKSWDSAQVRLATWVILLDKNTGKEIFCINTHLDHIGQMAREKGAKLIMERIAAHSRGLPVIFTGDLNATPETGAIAVVFDPENPVPLRHSRDIAAKVEGPNTTTPGGRFIDYVCVSSGIRVNRYLVMPFERGGIQLSDHRAVLTEVVVE